jgi:hypothetical protein
MRLIKIGWSEGFHRFINYQSLCAQLWYNIVDDSRCASVDLQIIFVERFNLISYNYRGVLEEQLNSIERAGG